MAKQYQNLYDFTNNLASRRNNSDEWIIFYSAFALQLLKEHKKAYSRFTEIENQVNEPIIKLLVGYFRLHVLKEHNNLNANQIAVGKKTLHDETVEKVTYPKWQPYLREQKQEIDILVLNKVIEDANQWIISR